MNQIGIGNGRMEGADLRVGQNRRRCFVHMAKKGISMRKAFMESLRVWISSQIKANPTKWQGGEKLGWPRKPVAIPRIKKAKSHLWGFSRLTTHRRRSPNNR